MKTDIVDLEREEAKDEAKQEEIETRRPKRLKLLFGLGGFLLLAAIAGTWLYFHYRDRVSTDNAQVDGHIMPVAAKVSGNVLDVLVNDNQFVKAGQVLVRIDPRDYQARVDQARATVALAQGQSRAASAGVPLTRATTASGTSGAAAQVAVAQADLARQEAAFEQASGADVAAARANAETKRAANDRAQADLNRMRPLVEKEEISRQQFDAYVAAGRMAAADQQAAEEKLISAQRAADTQRAGVEAARARIEQARAGLEQSRAATGQVAVQSGQAEAATASIEQARANLAAAELQLSYTTIIAPGDGVVTRKNVEPGQIVQPGQALMTIVPLHQVWVTANFKETQLTDVRAGQRAEVKVDMYDREIAGRVDSIAGATGARLSLLPPENATGNWVKVVQRIPVKIVFDSLPPGVTLRPGMNVSATIYTK